ncbi:hypothetical protein V1509DRAFT_496948 [Lipomyces kononenkoae]
MSSCCTMHLIEATGLHKKLDESVSVLGSIETLPVASDTRNRIFKVASFLNTLISYDYGRSAVLVGPITAKGFVSHPGDIHIPTVRSCRSSPF